MRAGSVDKKSVKSRLSSLDSFWSNSARLTWFVKKAGEYGDVSSIGMFNRKNNDDRPIDAKAFRFTFSDEHNSTSIVPGDMADLASEPEIAERMPLRDRIAAILRDRQMTVLALAMELGSTPETIQKTMVRNEGKVFARSLGQGGVFQWTVLDQTASTVN